MKRFALYLALAVSACGGTDTNHPPFAVTSSDPHEGQTGVPRGSNVTLYFNRGRNFYFKAVFTPDAGPRAPWLTRDPTTGDIGGAPTMIIAPEYLEQAPFAPLTTYTLTADAQDLNGNGLARPFVLHFTTGAE
jgi:hypothetical protein